MWNFTTRTFFYFWPFQNRSKTDDSVVVWSLRNFQDSIQFWNLGDTKINEILQFLFKKIDVIHWKNVTGVPFLRISTPDEEFTYFQKHFKIYVSKFNLYLKNRRKTFLKYVFSNLATKIQLINIISIKNNWILGKRLC